MTTVTQTINTQNQISVEKPYVEAHVNYYQDPITPLPDLSGLSTHEIRVIRRRDPLCVCDVRTLRPEDLRVGAVEVPVMGEIQNYSIRKPAEKEGRHRFWFVNEQRPDEVLVFRIFDSRYADDEGNTRKFGCAHTSFEDPATKELEPRESIEVRSFCVF